ncbi:MAG: hypothetical protein U1D55_17875 [Phycisphaerae bacterium]
MRPDAGNQARKPGVNGAQMRGGALRLLLALICAAFGGGEALRLRRGGDWRFAGGGSSKR